MISFIKNDTNYLTKLPRISGAAFWIDVYLFAIFLFRLCHRQRRHQPLHFTYGGIALRLEEYFDQAQINTLPFLMEYLEEGDYACSPGAKALGLIEQVLCQV